MLQIIRAAFTSQGLCEEVTDVILQGWRRSTSNAYKTYLAKWTAFCQLHNLNWQSTNIASVRDFLLEFKKQGAGYSTINTARSALSGFVKLAGDNTTIGTHHLVTKFMKGIFMSRPPKPRYTHIWDTSQVLLLLKKWSPVENLNLKLLTYKLVMLIALLSAPRCQTLKALDINNMAIVGGDVSFYVNDLLKTDKQGKRIGMEINFSEYPPDRRLCVLRVLKKYLEKTESLRKDNGQLFVSYKHPHEPVSTDTLARWIRSVLTLAGIDTKIFKAHSVRAASSSAASRFVPIEDILRKGKWASEHTFTKFYKKPIHTNAYQSSILNSCPAEKSAK